MLLWLCRVSPAVSRVRLAADAPSKSADAAASSSSSSAAAPIRASSIVLTAAGPDRPGIVHDMSALLSGSAGANVEESRMTILGNDFAIILRVTVPETQSPAALQEMLSKAFPEFVVSARSTTTHPIFTAPVRIFSVAVEGPDQPGIVSILTKLFLEHKGSVRDLDTDTSNAPFAGYKIFSLKSVVALPINADFAAFEASLHKFEDEYGFDVDVNEGMNDSVEEEGDNQGEGEEEEPEQEEEEEEEEEPAPQPTRRLAPASRAAPSAAAARGPAAAAARAVPPPAARRPGVADVMGPPPTRSPSRVLPPLPSSRAAPAASSVRGPATPARAAAPTGPSRGPVRKA